ncbi:MAG: tRNA (N6-threonylcarbamoyladenosine(37)-N6)-methyltransferase TrmO [Prevotella sp.]|nr:tRNA (N6-threonylcarbamoyladenosine(37)-N6)-methyltransferase TrmO [Prevotella sp.]
MTLKTIAKVRAPFNEKFGIPRQSGLAELPSEIIFEPEYRVREAFRGLEGYSHLWLLWEFSEAVREEWSPTVRPPKLGGNTRMGVFATRSPYRPNPIGLSSVRLERIEFDRPDAPVLIVSGADILDGTPIYDIKPYLAYTDSHPDAEGGFALQRKTGALEVVFPRELLEKIPERLRGGLTEALAQDPRPAYQNSPERVYMMNFADFDLHFTVDGGVLTVTEVLSAKQGGGENGQVP